MPTNTITRAIVIQASPETVYDVVSRPEHIAEWFSDEADLEPTADTVGVLIWRNKDTNEATTVEVTVVSADRPRLFSFTWIAPDRQRATPTATDRILVEFRIMAESQGTRLVVSESGLDAVDWDEVRQTAYAKEHGEGWDALLPRIRSRAEALIPEGS